MIRNKLALRIVVWLFAIAILFAVYQWYRGLGHDIDLPVKADTAGFIAAVERRDNGSIAVIFRPDGTKVEAPDYKAGAQDKEVVWRPDGNRLFFSSDRVDDSFNIYRWNTGRNTVERRSLGSRSQSSPNFSPFGPPSEQNKPLIIAGGFVLELDPKDGSAVQVLPPPQREIAQSGEEQTVADQFTTLYGRIGTSFKEARWGKDRAYIIAVMRREGGEVLVIQPTRPTKDADGKLRPALPVMLEAGDRIEIDVAPSGIVAASIIGFQFPDPNTVPEEFIKDNKVVPPFRHALVLVNPEKLGTQEVSSAAFVSATDKVCLQQPRFSPDGSKILAVGGSVKDGINFTPEVLVSLPAQPNGFMNHTVLLSGEIRDPSWRPDGKEIVFVKRDDQSPRAIYRIGANGSGEKRVSQDAASYFGPVFSPQTR